MVVRLSPTDSANAVAVPSSPVASATARNRAAARSTDCTLVAPGRCGEGDIFCSFPPVH